MAGIGKAMTRFGWSQPVNAKHDNTRAIDSRRENIVFNTWARDMITFARTEEVDISQQLSNSEAASNK